MSAALEIGVGVMREDMTARKNGSDSSNPGEVHYNLTEQASNKLYDLFHSDNKFNWLHKSVSTQFHKATIDRDFKRVFDLGQKCLLDNSRFAMDAADLAPSLLQKLGSLPTCSRKGRSGPTLKPLPRRSSPARWKMRCIPMRNCAASTSCLATQIALYREFREGINKSLDDLGVSEMARISSLTTNIN